ncbi:MAG TPA: hypothetical protein VGA79_07115, partial [Desulfobaccales bacterium]
YAFPPPVQAIDAYYIPAKPSCGNIPKIHEGEPCEYALPLIARAFLFDIICDQLMIYFLTFSYCHFAETRTPGR